MTIISEFKNWKFSRALNFACDVAKKEAYYYVTATIDENFSRRNFQDFGEAVDYYNSLPMTPEEVKKYYGE